MKSSGWFSNIFKMLVTAQMHMCMHGTLARKNKNLDFSRLSKRFLMWLRKAKDEIDSFD